jgi:hypothetical protein
MNEKQRRYYLASEALSLGRGGIKLICELTGVSNKTIDTGIKEIKSKSLEDIKKDGSRCRKAGGGRKLLTDHYDSLERDLLCLLESNTKGYPVAYRNMLYTSKSIRNLASELISLGYKISYGSLPKLLIKLGYSLQTPKKEKSIYNEHNDRNTQFEYINNMSIQFQENNNPVISIDAKKKENIGDFKPQGKELYPKHEAPQVFDHDFVFKALYKATPYGIYDIYKNLGFVTVGIDKDTAEFSANAIRSWWNEMGKELYPNSKELLITADAGGSNGYRIRLWKIQLQKLANDTGLSITMLHYPPGTSKWNKIEHRLFSFISKNWRGKVLSDLSTIVNLIGSTKTSTGLKVKCVLDEKEYKSGIKVTNSEFSKINITHHSFHGEWNYKIEPNI